MHWRKSINDSSTASEWTLSFFRLLFGRLYRGARREANGRMLREVHIRLRMTETQAQRSTQININININFCLKVRTRLRRDKRPFDGTQPPPESNFECKKCIVSKRKVRRCLLTPKRMLSAHTRTSQFQRESTLIALGNDLCISIEVKEVLRESNICFKNNIHGEQLYAHSRL